MLKFILSSSFLILLISCSPKLSDDISADSQNMEKQQVQSEAELVEVISEHSEVAPTNHQLHNGHQLTTEKIQKLDAYFDLLEENHKMMGAFSFSSHGEIIYERYLGLADVESGKAINKNSKFRIGSISKTFTSVLIYQLIEDGKLHLDDKLSQFFPQVPEAENIIISNLLNHRSGIFNFTNAPDFMAMHTKPATREQMLNKIISFDRAFEVDSKASYSNSGYLLLSWIIEDLYKQSYAEVLQEKIIKPLALKNTMYGGKIAIENNEVRSYLKDGKSWSVTDESDMSIPSGAGAIVSTVNDLNYFYHQLFKGNLVNETSIASMSELIEDYGRGLFQIPFYEHVALGHNGGIDGFHSNAFHFTELGLGGAITVNGNNYNMNDAIVGALSIYFGKAFELPSFDQKEITIATEEIDKYAGTYASVMMPLKITLFETDGNLMAQATGQGAFPLNPYEDGMFTFDKAGIVLQFAKAAEGGIDYKKFELRQGGGSYMFNREN